MTLGEQAGRSPEPDQQPRYKKPLDAVRDAFAEAIEQYDELGHAPYVLDVAEMQKAFKTADLVIKRGELSVAEVLMREGILVPTLDPFGFRREDDEESRIYRSGDVLGMLANLGVVPEADYSYEQGYRLAVGSTHSEYDEFMRLLSEGQREITQEEVILDDRRYAQLSVKTPYEGVSVRLGFDMEGFDSPSKKPGSIEYFFVDIAPEAYAATFASDVPIQSPGPRRI